MQERIIIFGASLGGERALRTLPKGRTAVAFCDNAAAKHGTQFRGLPVVSPAQLAVTPHERVLIASSYYPEIFNQLVDLGISTERIDILDDDTLNGLDEPTSVAYWLVGGIAVVLALALYGLVRLIFG